MLWDMFRALIVLLAVWILLAISIFFHEMGHVLMYVLTCGKNDWYVEIGRPGLKLLEVGKFKLYANMTRGRAYCYYNEFNKDNRIKYILMLLGGVMVNLIFVILLRWYLYTVNFETYIFFNWCINFFYYCNLYEFLVGIIPMKIGNYTSDGMWVYKAIFDK